ncbi:cobalt-precorrin-5B (C(1))-methyltransferase CbiD [uncultured Blautia sp.]|uniref:cobalt-precorrin-5B (C(1))-methyltransferase CbiD n=1 Tax=uncultured Blautia sp. TaxID=765821 RepID=UPI00280A89BF|nr:cobalt-precorrin-5B (C(1))-methyltransferase CbiD [uncultured Blautia sp.]
MAHRTGLEDHYVIRNQKKLRFGYTTGSCAAAAVKGAAEILLGGKKISEVELMTPKGILLNLELLDIRQEENAVSCAVRKDAGDDPDTTDGILVYARAEKLSASDASEQTGMEADQKELTENKDRFLIDGGAGVGRVTRPGLKQPVGEAAINPVPKAMILRSAEEAADRFDYEGRLKITISVPKGEEIAKKTFNPRLGIVGGISILGTSGIVEPMSEKALIDSIRVEMSQHIAMEEEYLLVTPGNYGADFLREHMELPFEKNIKCSNYVGETIDMAVDMGAKGILFVAHIGKFIKVAAGIMNTHSHSADGRMEVFCAAAVRAGGSLACAQELLQCNTTDEALSVLKKYDLMEEVMKVILEKIQFYLDHRSYHQILLGAVIFSNEYGYLGQTANASELIKKIAKGEKE